MSQKEQDRMWAAGEKCKSWCIFRKKIGSQSRISPSNTSVSHIWSKRLEPGIKALHHPPPAIVQVTHTFWCLSSLWWLIPTWCLSPSAMILVDGTDYGSRRPVVTIWLIHIKYMWEKCSAIMATLREADSSQRSSLVRNRNHSAIGLDTCVTFTDASLPPTSAPPRFVDAGAGCHLLVSILLGAHLQYWWEPKGDETLE